MSLIDTLFTVVVQIAVINAVSLYPNGDKQIIASNDDSAIFISLSPALPFYGSKYSNCLVNTNGIVVLRNGTVPVKQTLQTFLDVPFPIQNHTFIAPFYGDVDTRGLEPGVVWYSDTVTSDSETLQQAQRQIRDAFPVYGDFSPVYLIVATWDHVGYYEKRNDKLNTFQSVIATDGNTSFAIFLYDAIQWTNSARVGFNEGVNNYKAWEMPCSGDESIAMAATSSNVGLPGTWIFRIDGEDIAACPNKDNQTDCESDGLCSCLTGDPQQKCQCKKRNAVMCNKDGNTAGVTPDDGDGSSTNTIAIAVGVTFLVLLLMHWLL